MVRLEGWELRLSRFLNDRKDMPFQWFENDCLSFTAAAVKEITGVDYFSDFNDYKNEETALKMLKKNGGVKGIIIKCLGQPHQNYRIAKRGDIVMVKAPLDMGAVVDDTGGRVAVVTKDGLKRLPLNRAIKVWEL